MKGNIISAAVHYRNRNQDPNNPKTAAIRKQKKDAVERMQNVWILIIV
jgi:hypothetical protein